MKSGRFVTLVFLAFMVLIAQEEGCPEQTCDKVDNDNDGIVDDGFDNDYDGYMNKTDCRGVYSQDELDCNDDNPEIHPGAIDICGNAIDEDCDNKDRECTFRITGSYPSINAVGVPLQVQARFYFSEAFEGKTSTLHMKLKKAGGSYATLSATLAPAGTFVSSSYLTLDADTHYCVRLDVDADPIVPSEGALSYESCFTTELPCGTSVQLTKDVMLQQFGADDGTGQQIARDFLNQMLAQYDYDLPVAMMFDGVRTTASFPLSGFLTVIGEYTPGSPAQAPSSGWSTSMEGCTISASGTFACVADTLALPVPFNTFKLFMSLRKVNMDGLAKSTGNFTDIDTYVMRAAMTYEDISELAVAAGVPSLADTVQLDVDLDNDGKYDAATVVLTSEPIPLTLDGCIPF